MRISHRVRKDPMYHPVNFRGVVLFHRDDLRYGYSVNLRFSLVNYSVGEICLIINYLPTFNFRDTNAGVVNASY